MIDRKNEKKNVKIQYFDILFPRNTAVVERIVPYILAKTQHRYSTVREFAMKNLAALILEDYLKFRGILLVYVLAGLLDQQREVKELAVELIMKYTLEKNDIFLRTCLVECPFVFNGCACFSQMSSVSHTGNILKGVAKKAAREYIYQYLLRKIEPVYLYMYFGNITRLLEFIKNNPMLAKSNDLQASIADFLYICSEICIVNEKQKKNLEKIFKENHNGEGLAADDEDDDDQNNLNADKGNETGGNERKGRGNKKKKEPTLQQSLAAVDKIVPLIASIDKILKAINPNLFHPVIDKLCTNMCLHFESLIEYAQPREFWAKYLQKKIKKPSTTSTSTSRKSTKKSQEETVNETESQVQIPSTSSQAEQSKSPKPHKRKENDSGLYTIDEIEDDRSVSRVSNRNRKRLQSDVTEDEIEDDRISSKKSVSRASNRNKKRSQSNRIKDDNDSDSSAFSELSEATTPSRKKRSSIHQTTSTSSKKQRKISLQTSLSRKLPQS